MDKDIDNQVKKTHIKYTGKCNTCKEIYSNCNVQDVATPMIATHLGIKTHCPACNASWFDGVLWKPSV